MTEASDFKAFATALRLHWNSFREIHTWNCRIFPLADIFLSTQRANAAVFTRANRMQNPIQIAESTRVRRTLRAIHRPL